MVMETSKEESHCLESVIETESKSRVLYSVAANKLAETEVFQNKE